MLYFFYQLHNIFIMDYYKILCLEKDCTQEDIEKAYIKLSSKSLHMKDKLTLLSNAFEVLYDENKRKKYDTEGQIYFNFTPTQVVYDYIHYPQKGFVTRLFCNRYRLHNDFLIHDEIENSHILGRG